MKLIDNAEVQKLHFLGNYQQTLAGPDQGLKTFEVWRVTLAPGNEIPEIRHEGEVAVLTMQGTGRLVVDGEQVARSVAIRLPPSMPMPTCEGIRMS